MYFKISNWKRRIWTDRESYRDEWRIHQEFTPTKEIQKIQYLKTQTSNTIQIDKLKRKWKGGPIRTYANALVQSPRRRSPSQENKQKTGRDQSPNVTSRNTSTNDLSIEEPTPIEKKNPIFEPQQGKTNTC